MAARVRVNELCLCRGQQRAMEQLCLGRAPPRTRMHSRQLASSLAFGRRSTIDDPIAASVESGLEWMSAWGSCRLSAYTSLVDFVGQQHTRETA